jgi:flagellin-like protein
MKGVSPIIASVILIGIAFAAYIIVSGWGSGFLRKTFSSEEMISEKLDCSLGSVKIRVAVYNATSKTLYVLVRNDGHINLKDIAISIVINDTARDYEGVPIDGDVTLLKGTEKVYTITLPGGCFIKLLRVSTSCTDVYDTISGNKIVFYGC